MIDLNGGRPITDDESKQMATELMEEFYTLLRTRDKVFSDRALLSALLAVLCWAANKVQQPKAQLIAVIERAVKQ